MFLVEKKDRGKGIANGICITNAKLVKNRRESKSVYSRIVLSFPVG